MNKTVAIVAGAVVGVLVVAGAVVVFLNRSAISPATTAIPVNPASGTKAFPAAPNQNSAPAAPVSQIKLTITAPVDKSVVATNTITVTGQTIPNADVSVNEVDTKADGQGNFSAKVQLTEGDNPIVINAFDANGAAAEKEILVTYQPAGQ